MADPALKIELCPETGICSLLKRDGTKVDLMPFEAQAIREAGGDAEKVRAVIAESDPSFAAALNDGELAELRRGV